MTEQSAIDDGSVPLFCRDSAIVDVSTALLLEIAERTSSPVEELPSLYDAIDPEALNRLLDSDNDTLRVTIQYGGFAITLTPSEISDIQPLE